MEERRTTGGGHIAPIVYFAATATTAAIMFVATVVAWLTEAIGSLTWATLIVGSFFLFVAWLIYVLAVRHAINHFRNRLDTIYEVAYAVQNGYKVAFDLVRGLLEQIMHR
jgi:hypothetical protein